MLRDAGPQMVQEYVYLSSLKFFNCCRAEGHVLAQSVWHKLSGPQKNTRMENCQHQKKRNVCVSNIGVCMCVRLLVCVGGSMH